jgi:uncharacterized protein
LSEVAVRTFREIDLAQGTVIAAFPSVGLVSTISSTYLISTLESDQVCALDSPDFPSISMIYAQKPKFPARVYALHNQKVAVFICEVPLPARAHRPVAYCLLKWAQAHNCRQIVSLEGFPSEQKASVLTMPRVWGVGSTDRARNTIEKHGVSQLESGVIAGVTGVLLNEGRWQNYDVIALLAEARQDLPDAQAAVSLTRSLDALLPELKVDLTPLEHQAQRLEEHIQQLKKQAKPVVTSEAPPMYR